MAVCGACSTGNPDSAKFCAECGTRLPLPGPVDDAERKVVSILFCDLVGFTATADGADPEDVRAVLGPYHARAKAEIESYGGTVEKFIGDAVMAVFGAPVAHEDDPERSVLAALDVLAAIPQVNAEHGLDLAVRLGVATGEVVVSLDVRPERGEGLVAGDVVNTAARLQTAAPTGGVVVDAATHAASLASVRYGDPELVILKGKGEPVEVWPALSARGSTGGPLDHPVAGLVGRDDVLGQLQEAYADVLGRGAGRLVSVVGEPGLGKSRLLQAFGDWVDERDELVTWRQGRCRPYGSGTSVAALADVVRAQVGIDAVEAASSRRAKLVDAVRTLADLPDSEADWLVDRLAPLVGLTSTTAPPEELFTAWGRFCALLAGHRPVVIVLEDLHWATAQLLDFLPRLLRTCATVPLLVLITARPEIDQLRAGRDEVISESTIRLRPLDDDAVASLMTETAGRGALTTSERDSLLRRCGGNPLYVLEILRLVAQEPASSVAAALTGLPSSVSAIVAARLDLLPRPERVLVRIASVLGDQATVRALGELAGRPDDELGAELADLVRRSVLRETTGGSIDEARYAFTHALIGEVAYGQLARPARARYHLSAGAWLAATAETSSDGGDDLAAIVAGHATTAHQLLGSFRSEPDSLRRAADLAVTWQLRAGHVALRTDAHAAARHLRDALGLMGADDRRRPGLLLEVVASHSLAPDHARELCREARLTALEQGDVAGAALALVREADCLLQLDGSRSIAELLLHAVAELEQLPPGPVLAEACSVLARNCAHNDQPEGAIQWADQVIDVAHQSGAVEPGTLSDALCIRGVMRGRLGRPGGPADLERALDVARRHRLARQSLKVECELTEVAERTSFPAAAALSSEVAALAVRVDPLQADLFEGNLRLLLAVTGRLADGADRLTQDGPMHFAGPPTRSTGYLACVNALILTLIDRRDDALRAAWWALPASRGDEVSALGLNLLVLLQAGVPDTCRRREVERELLALVDRHGIHTTDPVLLPWLGRTVMELSRPDLVRRLQAGSPVHLDLGARTQLTLSAMLAEAGTDVGRALDLHVRAADGWEQHGAPFERLAVLLGQARCLDRLGRDPALPLEESRRITRVCGSPFWARRVDRQAAELGLSPAPA